MIQPSRVLPSNAPPLQDGNSVHHAPRVLQEQSGNRQQIDFVASHGLAGADLKYPTPLLTENVWQGYGTHVTTQQLYHPQPHPQTWSYNHSRLYNPHQSLESEQYVQAKADQLYRRFKNAPLYKKYRQRQSKDDKGSEDRKWPDHLEEAFFYALVKYPPMGRRQMMHKGKQRGRNELIADAIQELTGEERKRKQVSSHIQVLKPFVQDDPYLMRYLSKEDMGPQDPRHMSDHHGYNGRRMSTYPAAGPPYPTRNATQPAPQTDLVRLAKVKNEPDVFEPTTFSMFVQRKFLAPNGEPQEERLHTYTQSIDQPLGPDMPVQDWMTLERDYPHLATMHSKKALDCNIIAADASLGLITETFRDRDGVELGISFVCSSRHLTSVAQIECRNSFYRHGTYLSDFSGACKVNNLQCAKDGHGVTASVKFGSTFWARTLAQLAARLREGAAKDIHHRDDVRAFIRGITAVQEIVAVSQHGEERLLIMVWTFRQSSAVTGRTSWRRLLLPLKDWEKQDVQSEILPRPERVNSMYDYDAQFADLTASQAHASRTLQSPFEYENSSGSALSSATWPTSTSDGSGIAQSQAGDGSFLNDNDLDFNSGSINMAYDPSLDFCGFDSSTFDFDGNNVADFAADPTLEQYSQQWCADFANSFDNHAPLSAISADTSFATQLDNQPQVYDAFTTSAAAPCDPQMYGEGGDQQAFGGAGQEGIKHEDDALTALADASFLAQGMVVRQSLS